MAPPRFRPVRIIFANLRRYYGWADKDNWTITVDPRLPDKKLMYAALHETLHVEQWDLAEEAVRRISKAQADVLDRLGFHRTHEDD